jgi:hypothetical protein
MEKEEQIVQMVRTLLQSLGEKDLDELAGLVRQTAGQWDACLEGVTEEQAMLRPSLTDPVAKPWSGEGAEWCVKEVVSHYIVSERSLNNVVAELAGVPAPDPSAAEVRKMGVTSMELNSIPVSKLRRELARFFDDTLTFVDALRGHENPGATFPHPVFGPLNAKEWVAFHYVHTMDHIGQVEAIKREL